MACRQPAAWEGRTVGLLRWFVGHTQQGIDAGSSAPNQSRGRFIRFLQPALSLVKGGQNVQFRRTRLCLVCKCCLLYLSWSRDSTSIRSVKINTIRAGPVSLPRMWFPSPLFPLFDRPKNRVYQKSPMGHLRVVSAKCRNRPFPRII
jgi:hypothetical protein